MTMEEGVAAARAHRAAHGARIVRDLADLCAIPNVSSDTVGIERNAEHLRAMLAARGVDVSLRRVDGAAPLVVGRLEQQTATRTVGLYLHYDGQPVNPQRWRQDPFSPTLYTRLPREGGQPRPLPEDGEDLDPEWRLYARGVADDRAPAIAICHALDALRARGLEPTVNLVFAWEGEEEIGSPNLGRLLEANAADLAADVWHICDGPVHQSRRAQIVLGVRGYSGCELTVYGPSRELHSGHYGNWAHNPAMTLARLLATMKDASGTIRVEGIDQAGRVPTPAELDAARVLADIDEALLEDLAMHRRERRDEAWAESLLSTSLNVRGLTAADTGAAARNVVPATATASLDLRLAPGAEPDEVIDLVAEHLRRQGAYVVEEPPDEATRRQHPIVVWMQRDIGYPGVRTSPDHPTAQAALAAARAAAGHEPYLLPTFGGSVPLHHFTTHLQTPVVITPMANHDDDQHAPDENLRIGNLEYGVDLMAAVMSG